MPSTLFLKNKIARQLITNGKMYSFNHYVENEYKELEFDSIIELNGLYHEKNSFEVKNTVDGAITHSKKSPMILCLKEDAEDISTGDSVIISDVEYKVVSKNNIQNFDVAYDISLEVVT